MVTIWNIGMSLWPRLLSSHAFPSEQAVFLTELVAWSLGKLRWPSRCELVSACLRLSLAADRLSLDEALDRIYSPGRSAFPCGQTLLVSMGGGCPDVLWFKGGSFSCLRERGSWCLVVLLFLSLPDQHKSLTNCRSQLVLLAETIIACSAEVVPRIRQSKGCWLLCCPLVWHSMMLQVIDYSRRKGAKTRFRSDNVKSRLTFN